MVNMRIQRPSRRSVLTALNDCEPPLTQGAEAERQVVDLRLHHRGDGPVALGAAPHLALGPQRVLAQGVHRRVVVAARSDRRRRPPGDLIGQRQVARIEDAGLGPEEAQQAGCLLDGQARKRTSSQRAIQQQDARRMPERIGQAIGRSPLRLRPIERGQVIGIGQVAQSVHGSQRGESEV
eukprot:gene2369-3359_t